MPVGLGDWLLLDNLPVAPKRLPAFYTKPLDPLHQAKAKMFIAYLDQQNLIKELRRCTIFQIVITANCVLWLEGLFSVGGNASI